MRKSLLALVAGILLVAASVDAIDYRPGAVSGIVAGTCITITGLTIATCQNLSTTGTPTFGGLTLNGTLAMGSNAITSTGTLGAGTTTLSGNLVMSTNAITFTDATLVRQAANTLNIRNGTSGQFLLVYGTYTDDNNGEWLELSSSTSQGRISQNANGTGTLRFFEFGSGGATWRVMTDGVLQPTTSGRDVGSSVNQIGTAYIQTLRLMGTAFASLGTPSDGTVVMCTNCDPPTLVDQTCTSAGTQTGSLAVRTNGAWKCIS